MSLRIINRFTKTADYNPQLIGSFDASVSGVNINVWSVSNGTNHLVDIANSGCYQIGDTYKWGWSTEYIPFVSGHYYFEMISNTLDTCYGEFFLGDPNGMD